MRWGDIALDAADGAVLWALGVEAGWGAVGAWRRFIAETGACALILGWRLRGDRWLPAARRLVDDDTSR